MSINFVERAVHGLFTSTKTTVSTVLDSDGVLKNTLHNLFINSAVGATQTITVTSGQYYRCAFKGTGSITFSGGHSETLNGTGADDLVGVYFTPSTTSVTCTVSGSITEVRFYRAAVHAPVERVTNGDGSSTTGWSAENSGVLTVVSGEFDVENGAAALGYAVRGVPTVAGETYRYSIGFNHIADGDGFFRIGTTSGSGDLFETTNLTADQTIVGTFVATTAITYLRFGNYLGTLGHNTRWDNVSVTKVITNGMQTDLSGSDYVETSGSAEFHAGLEYDGNGAFRGLQAFEGRTNYATNSNGAPTGTGITATANAAVGLDGDLSLTRVAKDATDPRYFGSATTGLTVAAATNYVVSMLVKYDGYALDVSLEYNSNLNWDVAWSADFSVAASVVTAGTAANCTSGVDDLGGGIYRIWATFTTGASPTGTNPSVLSQITGGSGNSVLVSEFNVQAGKSVSPEIPTNGSTVSRGADVTFKALSEFGFKQDQYTVIVEFESAGSDGGDNPAVFSISDGTSSNDVEPYMDTSNNLRLFVASGGVTQSSAVIGAYTPSNTMKLAAAYKANDFAASDDGTAVVTDTSGEMPPVTKVRLGQGGGGGQHLNGYIKKMVIYPARLTDATLVAESA